MNHVCTCKNAKRTLMLWMPGLATTYGKVVDYAATDKAWRASPGENCVEVTLGECTGFHTIVEVMNFLRTLLDESLVRAITATWVDPMPTKPLTPMDLLAKAAPLVAMAAQDSGPLLSLLKENRLTTHFQPIFKAARLELWGYECLMRGQGSDGKMISPAQIIAWAQQEQLIFMLDRVCRETHLRNAGRAGIRKDAMLLINFMPTAIYQPAYCLQTTMAAAREADIDPARIVFEVVEQYEVPDRDHLAGILHYYRDHGYRVALDDLGSGYAGLNLLADLDPDLIKIDRDLVSKAVKSPTHRAVVDALIRIGHDTDKLVLAEGVETAEETELMRNLGADLLQGFYLGKPAAVPATEPLHEAQTPPALKIAC
jgi:EAL domain-containing protein (putative c-di-GMP-specific phosphodiesterase class I)